LSPEQESGLEVDERTDIWSLGVLLYELLARRPHFTGATRMDTIVAILEREPSSLVQSGDDPLVRGLWAIVDRILRKDAVERYQSAAELLSDLSAIRQQLEIVGCSSLEVALSLLRQSMPEVSSAHKSKVVTPRASFARASSSWLGDSSVYHRYRLFALAVGLIVTLLLGGVFLYRRFGTNAKTGGAAAALTGRLYTNMNEAEQLQFVDEQEQRISAMMGERPVKLNQEALQTIKRYVDRYAAREESVSNDPGKENLNLIYARATPYVPLIARSFAAGKITIVVGIYLPMIESEYKPCFVNQIGATGLFQFLPSTAKIYGVAREDMCDVEKVAPAAAHYIADRMAELGEDSETMTLVLLSYNQGPGWVTDTLRQLRNTDNYQRNFWTIYANRDKLSDNFRKEAGYVPEFFAAAIVGENPRNFGLSTPALSTLAKDNR